MNMLKALRKTLGYTTEKNIRLFLGAQVAVLISGYAVFEMRSAVLASGAMALSLVMWWPFTRDLWPVCWRVFVHGRWPDGQSIEKPID